MSLAPASMRYNEKMFSRQLGRNAQLFAQQLGRLETAEARYPYLRQLLAVIEEARPEWGEAEHRSALFAQLVRDLCGPALSDAEIEAAVRARDAERALATADLTVPFTPPAPETPEAGASDAMDEAPSADLAGDAMADDTATTGDATTDATDDAAAGDATTDATDDAAAGDAMADDVR